MYYNARRIRHVRRRVSLSQGNLPSVLTLSATTVVAAVSFPQARDFVRAFQFTSSIGDPLDYDCIGACHALPLCTVELRQGSFGSPRTFRTLNLEGLNLLPAANTAHADQWIVLFQRCMHKLRVVCRRLFVFLFRTFSKKER